MAPMRTSCKLRGGRVLNKKRRECVGPAKNIIKLSCHLSPLMSPEKRFTSVLLSVMLLFIWAVPVCDAQDNRFLKEDTLSLIGVRKTEPWVYEEGGVVKGIDYEVFQEIAKRLGFDFQIQMLPFRRALLFLEQGKKEAILLIYYKKEREGFLEYVIDEPMHFSTYFVYVVKGKEFEINSIEDLYGKKIGKNRGFTISDEFDEAVRSGKILIDEVETRDQNIEKLLLGRIDAFVSNYASAQFVLKKMGMLDKIHHLEYPLVDKGVYLAFSKKSPNIVEMDELVKAVTKTLIEIKEDGTYQQIVDRYLK